MSSLPIPTDPINPAAALAEAEARYRAALAEAEAQYREALPPGAVLPCLGDEPAIIPIAAGPIPFETFVAELLELYGPSIRSKSTRRGMVHAIGMLRSLGVRSTRDLTVSLIARLVSTRDPKLSRNTVRGLLRYVQAACNYAEKSGYLKTSPFHIRGLRTWVRPSPPAGKKHQTREEIGRLLAVLQSDVDTRKGWALWRARRLQAMVATAAWTGLRRGELLWLAVADVDLFDRRIQVVDRATHRLKTENAGQPVPIPTGLVPILQSWLEHREDCPPGFERSPSPYVFRNLKNAQPWTGGSIGSKPLDRLKAAGVRAGISDGLTWHSLRRSVATNMEAIGCGQAMITRILRHTSSAVTTAHYQQADLRNMLEAMDVLRY